MIKLLFIIGVIAQSGLLVSGNGVCDGLPNFTLVNNPKSCAAFFICFDSVPYESTCPDGLYFSMVTNQCENKDTVNCGNSIVECQPNDEDGTVYNNPDKCEFFYICLNSVAVSVQCPGNLVFNTITKLCDTRQNYPCENVVSPCEGVASGLVINQENCEKFFACDNGFVLYDLWCGPNLFFSEELKTCTNFDEAKCKSGYTECSGVADNILINNPEACDAYSLCYQGQPIRMNCTEGENFNTNSSLCDSNFTCDIDVDTVCLGIPNNEFINNPESCSAYFRCFNDEAITAYCEEPYFFNPELKKCDHQYNVECEDPVPTTLNPLCTDVEEGAFIANPVDCQKWYRCNNGQVFEGSCDDGYYFDPAREICDYDELVDCQIPTPDDICINKPADVAFVEIPGKCDSYGRCNSENILDIIQCPSGFWFNFDLQLCDLPANVDCEPTTTIMPDTPCVDIVDGIYLSDPFSCNGYILCKNETGTLGYCPDGYYFHFEMQGCRYKENVDCNLEI